MALEPFKSKYGPKAVTDLIFIQSKISPQGIHTLILRIRIFAY